MVLYHLWLMPLKPGERFEAILASCCLLHFSPVPKLPHPVTLDAAETRWAIWGHIGLLFFCFFKGMSFKLHIYLGAFVTYCDPILVIYTVQRQYSAEFGVELVNIRVLSSVHFSLYWYWKHCHMSSIQVSHGSSCMLMTWQLSPTLWKSVCQSSRHGRRACRTKGCESTWRRLRITRLT